MANKLKQYLLSGALFLLSAGVAVAAPLITADALHESVAKVDNQRIIDIRPADDYAAGHVPGAVSAPYNQWRGPAASPGQVLETAELTRLVRQLGIDADTHVVVVSSGADATDFGASRSEEHTSELQSRFDLV